MNTPNPLIPQGTFADNRGRSHFRIAFFTILAVHVVLLGALLMAGCKKNPEESATDGKGTSGSYSNIVLPTELPPPTSPPTSAPVVIAPVPTNQRALPPPENPIAPLAGGEYVVLKNYSFSS